MFWGLSWRQLKTRHCNWTYRQHWFFLLYAVVLVSFIPRTGLIAQPTADSFLSSGLSDAWRTQWASASTDTDDADDQLALQDADQDDDSLLLLSVFSLLPLLEAAFFLFHEQQALLSSSFFSPLGARSPPSPAH